MIIIPSGKPKIWDTNKAQGPTVAEQVYTGTFHKLCKEYAKQQCGNDYLILSPYYGFIHPDTVLTHTYDVRFTSQGTTKETISIALLKKQWSSIHISTEESIIVLGGKKFIPLLQDITDQSDLLSFPLVGLGGIGYMQRELKHAIKSKRTI